MTTRHEVAFEMLPLLATAVSSVDELLLHDASDGLEKRTTVAAVLAGVSSATGRSWTVGSTAPASPNVGDAWADTSRSEIAWRLWDGSTWQVIGPSVLDGPTIVAAINQQFGNINWQQGRNPRGVVSITVSDGTATVTHEDGSTSTFSVTSDDETARTLARNAQAAADAARGIADTNATAIAGIPAAIAAALDLQDVPISSGGVFESTLRSQATATGALLMTITANIDHTFEGTRYQYTAPTILYVPPMSMMVDVLYDSAQIANIVGMVEAGGLADGSVTTEKLANESVTTRKLAGNAVTQGKLANSAIIDTVRIFRNAVTGEKIAPNSINNGHMLDNAINTAELADGAVTLPKLASTVRDQLGGGGTGGTDQVARDEARAAQTTANAARTTANANAATIDRLAVFGQYELNPGWHP